MNLYIFFITIIFIVLTLKKETFVSYLEKKKKKIIKKIVNLVNYLFVKNLIHMIRL